MIDDSAGAGPREAVIQYCPTLSMRCGIATYTEALARAKGFRAVASLEEIGPVPPRGLHLQYEASIYPLPLLRSIVSYCRKNRAHLYVTMHTVVNLPSRAWFRLPPGESNLWRQIQPKLCRFLAAVGLLEYARRMKRAFTAPRVVMTGSGTDDATLPGKTPPPAPAFSGIDPYRSGPTLGMHIRKSERIIFRCARKVLVLTPEGRAPLRARGARRVGVTSIGIQAFEQNGLLFSSEDGRRHVGCFGFLNHTRCVLELVDACERLENTSLHLYMCTERVLPERDYERRVRERIAGLSWVEFEPEFLPIEDVVLRLSRCDVNVYLNSRLDHFSASGAIWQYVAARRPIVVSDSLKVGGLREAVHVVRHCAPLEIAEAIRNVKWNPAALEECLSARQWQRILCEYD